MEFFFAWDVLKTTVHHNRFPSHYWCWFNCFFFLFVLYISSNNFSLVYLIFLFMPVTGSWMVCLGLLLKRSHWTMIAHAWKSLHVFTCVIFVFTERGKYRCLNQIDKVINDYLYIELPCYTTLIHLHPHFIFHYAPTNHHMLMHMNKKRDHLLATLLSNSLRLNLYLYVIICWRVRKNTLIINQLF